MGLLVGAVLAWLLSGARGRERAAAAQAREAEVRRELERTRDEAKAASARLTEAENSRWLRQVKAAVRSKKLSTEGRAAWRRTASCGEFEEVIWLRSETGRTPVSGEFCRVL